MRLRAVCGAKGGQAWWPVRVPLELRTEQSIFKAMTKKTAEPRLSAAGATAGPGRPRSYDEGEVLRAALELFRRQGFEATSLDDLTQAMGISRSSLYAAFGSKQDVLLAALRRYSATALETLKSIGDAPHAHRAEAVAAMLRALADPSGGKHGCLLVNCITELAPQNEEVAALGRRHLERIEAVIAEALDENGPESLRGRARALAALAIGTLTLRKSGLDEAYITSALDEGLARLLAPPQAVPA